MLRPLLYTLGISRSGKQVFQIDSEPVPKIHNNHNTVILLG